MNLSIAKRFHKYMNTYSIMRTMKKNIQDTGIRLRKEFIQSVKGGSPVDRVHYSGAERLFILGAETGQRNPHKLFVWTEHWKMSRCALSKLGWRWTDSTHEKLFVQERLIEFLLSQSLKKGRNEVLSLLSGMARLDRKSLHGKGKLRDDSMWIREHWDPQGRHRKGLCQGHVGVICLDPWRVGKTMGLHGV